MARLLQLALRGSAARDLGNALVACHGVRLTHLPRIRAPVFKLESGGTVAPLRHQLYMNLNSKPGAHVGNPIASSDSGYQSKMKSPNRPCQLEASRAPRIKKEHSLKLGRDCRCVNGRDVRGFLRLDTANLLTQLPHDQRPGRNHVITLPPQWEKNYIRPPSPARWPCTEATVAVRQLSCLKQTCGKARRHVRKCCHAARSPDALRGHCPVSGLRTGES